MKTISVVINARLHSSRLPRKLLRPFAGTTLIEIALSKINQMDFFDHRYFAVAEDEFKQLTPKYLGVELLERSMESVKPGYGHHKVIYEHYSLIESDFIFWLNPCHPFLSIDTVAQAVDIFHRTMHNSYTAVVSAREWLFDHQGMPITNTEADSLSTGHSRQFYKVTHSFHIFNKAFFLKHHQVWTMTKNDPYLVEIPESENFDADTILQFETAEAVYLHRHRSV
jgi:CMP-N-acetylneuraminic acid synthetase